MGGAGVLQPYLGLVRLVRPWPLLTGGCQEVNVRSLGFHFLHPPTNFTTPSDWLTLVLDVLNAVSLFFRNLPPWH
jgi:hypothetical protein